MKKLIILIISILSYNCFSQKDETTSSKVWNNAKNLVSSFNDNDDSEYFFRDSILKIYSKKFSDFNLIEKWMKKNPPFLDNQKGNLYKVLKKTTVKADNSIIYGDINDLNLVEYIFLPHHKKNLFIMEFEIFEKKVNLISLTKINKGLNYEDKFDVYLDEKLKVKQEKFLSKVNPYFFRYKDHILFALKNNKNGNHRRIYFDLGYDIYQEYKKLEFIKEKLFKNYKYIPFHGTYKFFFDDYDYYYFNKTKRLLSVKMLHKL
ncbi:MAG: hypothetical protein COZ16_06170 [Flavobacteriaceae bacterium CG_4_10_14_3_um_filter_31_253]|nr:hypothetical protein [Flavobacteriia bacterium]PIV97308.1 MAG: hypothetical protein COW43_03650 [Flavobacteriaceae bacterium CG17_big_fil_post_rev_8_21_14_2_50_31_13]PIY14993.1 MAG: hypothetical protein COZ16_06170 [Flavobacteriaceae bacterium CG_4_10_14_3_um_filter_31_253]PIZ09644.1 MAG: hypothetical protein COY55_11875 [Flavobacteriaceae bacterium CG_4_10_14_0_8_um_filter_31_99]PJC10369.1 MAG: hypothetical protein CO067_04910 [Flavobacteriaceae bacterium CG_4_9_14_0_8_um_filter_31_91]